MAKAHQKQRAPTLAEAAPNPRRKGLEKVMYRLDPKQIQALRAEAFRRALERGSGKPDASEVLREIIDVWVAKKS
jgi:hypothetical protein